jgi:hypothetical protein
MVYGGGNMPETSPSRGTPLIAWFLGFGILDSGTVLVLAYIFHVSDSPIYLYLLPTVVYWGENLDGSLHGFFDSVPTFLILIGGSFVLYGLLGVLFGLIVRNAISFRSPH